jgi:drug/metabolite transporter (DMT)-like permease
MHSPRNLRPKTYVLLCLEVCFGALGNTLFDKGMKEIGALTFASGPEIWAGALRTFTSGTIWMGLLCMLLFIVCHMLVLSWADFSFVMPFSAVSYALVPLFAYLWFGEKVLPARWLAIGLIVIGVFLVSRTQPSTTQSWQDEQRTERG